MGSEAKEPRRLVCNRVKCNRIKCATLFLITTVACLCLYNNSDQPIILRNAAGAEAHVLLTGAILQRVRVPDRNGKFDDVVLGFDSETSYATSPYFGAVVGRVANRIANATFDLDGETFTLSKNEVGMPGSLHGGWRGLDKVRWHVVEQYSDLVILHYHSADGEEGYPGLLDIEVRYEMSTRSELVFDINARTSKPTPINIAQHTYWNLGGHASGSVLSHELAVHHGSHVLPIDAHRIPTGELRPVAGTPFDFLTPHTIGSRIESVDGPGWHAGYDHCFVLHGTGAKQGQSGAAAAVDSVGVGAALKPLTPRLAATLYHPGTGRTMEVHTTLPGLQLYTSNFLDGSIRGKENTVYRKYAGVCLETESLPDAVHHSHFPSIILRPGEHYSHRTLYAFSTRS